VTKLVTPDEKQSALFKLVSYITGFKNSLKGVGYFIGAGCLAASDQWGYYLALGINVCSLTLNSKPRTIAGSAPMPRRQCLPSSAMSMSMLIEGFYMHNGPCLDIS